MATINDKDFLLVIDMQNAYLPENAWGCARMREAVQFTVQTIGKFAEEHIGFSRFLPPKNPQGTWKEYNKANKTINRNVWMNEYVEELKPYLRESNTYSKSVYSCCQNEKLHEKIMHYDRVFVVGVVAECCVLSTVLNLIDMGKKVVYLTSGIAGKNAKKEAEVIHVLQGMSPLHIVFE